MSAIVLDWSWPATWTWHHDRGHLRPVAYRPPAEPALLAEVLHRAFTEGA